MAKITRADIQSANTSFKVDDFRQMVNYENTKNKGYVRFMKTTDGSFKLEKINNKIDVPLSWRSNVNAANNKEMRNRFVKALESGMKYMSETHQDRIRDMILSPKKDGEIERGKALSRLDVKAALDVYDQQINTYIGRTTILSNFFKKAMTDLHFKGTLEEFQRDYLCLDAHGINLDEYTQVKAVATVLHNSMVKDETSFLTLLMQLEERLVPAKQRVELDGALTDIAEQALSKSDNYGVHLSPEQEATLRSCLTRILTEKGIEDVDFGLGSKGTAMTMFMKMVMPVFLHEGLMTVREFGGDTEESRGEAIKEQLGMKNVLELAEAFMVGARNVVEGKKTVEDVKKNDIETLAHMIGQMGDNANKAGLNIFAQRFLMANVALKSDEAIALGAEVGKLLPFFNAESALGKYAVAFMKEHFPTAMAERPVEDKSVVEIGKEYVMKELKVAGQLVYGERWALGNGKYGQGKGAEAFISDMRKRAVEYTNCLKGGMDMFSKLMSYTVPNILNAKIEAAATDLAGKKRLHIDVESYRSVPGPEEQLARTAMVYDHFKYYIGEQLDKAMSRFEKHLRCQVKKGTMMEDTKAKLLNDFGDRLEQAKERAIERYFLGSPASVTSDMMEDVKAGLGKMMKLFEEEKSEALTEMNRRVVSETMLHGTGYEDRKLLLDAKARIKEYLPEVNHDDLKLGASLERLYFSLLADKMKQLKGGRKSLDEQFVADFKADFAKEAGKLQANVAKYSDKLVRTVTKNISDELAERIADKENNNFNCYQKLPKEERTAMIDAYTKDVLSYLQDDLRRLQDKLLEHPEVYGKKDLDALIDDGMLGDMLGSPVVKAISAVGVERILAVTDWIKSEKAEVDTFSQALQKTALAGLKEQNTGISDSELKNIVGRVVSAEKTRIDDFMLSYATGGKEAFLKRVNDEVQTAVDGKVKEYSKFRAEFLKKIQPATVKYGGLTDTVIQSKLDYMLDSFTKADKLPPMKEVVNGFTALLSKELDNIIKQGYDKFLEFSKLVTYMYESTAQPFVETLEAGIEKLREAGAQDDDIAYFREHIMPKEIDDFHAMCNDKADVWGNDSKDELAETAKSFANTSINQYTERLNKLNPSTEQGQESLVKLSGYGYLLDDEGVKDQVKNNLTTWAANPDTVKLLSEARKARMLQYAYCAEDYRPDVIKADATIEELKQSVKNVMSNIHVVVLEEKFQNTDLPTAKKLFLEWLEKYNLPKTEIGSTNSSKGTSLTDMAVEHFSARVVKLQTRIAEKEKVDEAILSSDYVKSFLKFISKRGLSIVMGEIGTAIANQRMTEISQREDNRDIFDVRDLQNRTNLSPEEKSAIMINNAGLQKLFQVGRERAEDSLRKTVLTLENLSRMEDIVKMQFKNYLPRINSYSLMCQTRMDMLRQLPELVQQSDRLMDEAIRDYFGEDIATTTKITETTRRNEKLGSIQQMVNFLHMLMAEEAQSIRKSLTEHALDVGFDPTTGNEIFPADYPGEPDHNTEPIKRLSNVFKDKAKAMLKTLENTKKGNYVSLIKQIRKDIQASNSVKAK